MEFAFRQMNGAPAVTMSGRFVYADAGKIHDIIAGWDFAAYPSVILDLKFVTFIDSSAIGMLFLLAKRAQEAGGALWLHNPSQSVSRTLHRAEMQTCAHLVEGHRNNNAQNNGELYAN